MNVPALSRVILELHRGGREVAYHRFQASALELIREIIPFDSAWWGNTAAESLEIHRLHLCNCDHSILDAYRPHKATDFFRAAVIAQPGVSINLADLTSRASYVRSALYRKFGKTFKVEWSLGTLMVEPVSSLYEFMTLWRHDGKNPFSESERQIKELLMPHLVDAHWVARLHQIFDQMPNHTHVWAVADERGYLREASPGFIHCLKEHWPDWQGSLLPEALRECVRSTRPYDSTGLKLHIVTKGAFRYLEALAVGPLDSLSPRERGIAIRYAKGETYAGIATALALSPATVRNHIANCYRKLAVNNKTELVVRVSLDGKH